MEKHPRNRANIVSVQAIFKPEFRPHHNAKLPWAVDYTGITYANGETARAGTSYFENETQAVDWGLSLVDARLDSSF